DPFRKITFILALGMIMGAAAVDVAIILVEAARRIRQARNAAPADDAEGAEPWKRTNTTRLVLWSVGWGLGVLITGVMFMKASLLFLLLGVALVFLFVMVNGISQGISDSNPISSAFVVTVLLLGTLGLASPSVGLMAASIVFVAVSVACDMQQ